MLYVIDQLLQYGDMNCIVFVSILARYVSYDSQTVCLFRYAHLFLVY